MESTFNYTRSVCCALSQQLQYSWRITLVVLAAFLLSGNAFAQTVQHPTCPKPNGDPNPPQCTSQDLQVIGAFLESSQCYCEAGDEITATLTMKLFNKTGSERTSFAFFAVLAKTNPDGSVEREYVKACTGPVLPGSESEVSFPGAITYTCGQTLALTDVYLAWTDASDGAARQCGGTTGLLNNFCTIDPKCGKAANIAITPLLTALITDTDGTCEGETDGSITVTASGGTGPYDFSISPGGATVSNDADGVYTFTGLAAGNYSITVEDAEGCEITVEGSVSEFPNPDQPTVRVTQPTCTTPTGKIEITSPTTGLEFSLNGGAFGAYPTEGYTVDAGATYTLVARSTSGCLSEPLQIVIEDAPIVPSGITLDVDQPDCENLTGRIEFTSPLGDYLYSIDGGQSYQPSPVFEELEPGMTYTLSVRSGDGCAIAGGTVEIDEAPIVPSGIDLDVVQPTCELLSGTITVVSPTGDYTYSINGGSYQTSNVFGGLAPGDYTISIRSGDGCVTASSTVTINPLPQCEVFAGCTLGYWKNHPGSWCDTYSTTQTYGSVFASAHNSIKNLTLMQALNLGGGAVNNLARQSVAALLNACHENVNYPLSEEEIIAAVNEIFTQGYTVIDGVTYRSAGALATYLDSLNNAGCTIDAHNRPIEMTVTSTSSLEGIKSDQLKAYPTPFSDRAIIEFTTSRTENFVVNLYDMKGSLIKQLKAGTAKAGELQVIEVDGAGLNEGLYIARMISDSGGRSVKLLLKRE